MKVEVFHSLTSAGVSRRRLPKGSAGAAVLGAASSWSPASSREWPAGAVR